MDLENQLVAPLTTEQAIGLVTVSLDGEPTIERELFALQGVPQGNLWQRLTDEIMLWFESTLCALRTATRGAGPAEVVHW